ncbi:PREDICTED: leucine-rich repeat extensin-like protein 3 isoform X2 [Nelumbo nucifera]|uniref:C2 domain-containing protein n=2 Tax=Nelumbo nucifera TaxID=4432 RepID=A0A822ZCE2_NELNU|nr:PREDICTED: leucine-rich repeat extensin-like protein 3 isoform X2 [Nelumbo nucifera]DAD41351.1 TPA_asm: hypothetical protein HUJ06_015674 [Nelumbo nucifera]
MSISGIQGQLFEVTVVGCTRLKDTEWISRQDPYVCLEYGGTKFRTRTCTDGGKNPTFQEKFNIILIEGLRELKVNVWNSNTLTYDDFIGSGTVQLQKVLSQGFDDTTWPLQGKSGRYAGEVRLILHYQNANKPAATTFAPSAPPYVAPAIPQAPPYPFPPAATAAYPPPATTYPAVAPYSSYPPNPAAYPPPAYPPPPPAAYPPPSYPPSAYPPQPYPPAPAASYYPPGPYPGIYPPPPY